MNICTLVKSCKKEKTLGYYLTKSSPASSVDKVIKIFLSLEDAI